MHKLQAPVPPQLEQAIGYDGEARYVAFYWGGGDEAYWNDGRTSATGSWQAYLTYVRHPRVYLHLAPYNFGNSDEEAEHWLVLARDQRTLYAAPWEEALDTLHRQWPDDNADLPQLTEAEWQELTERIEAELRRIPTQAEIYAVIEAQRRMIAGMTAWLNGHN